MELARGAACAGIMLNACELVMNFPEEVEYIWMTIKNFSTMKALYIFSRYFIFVVHMQNFYYSQKYQHLDPTAPAPPGLHLWVLYKLIIWQGFVGTVDAVLFKRVYLLHNRKRWIFIFLSCVALCRVALVSVTGILTFTRLRVSAPTGRDGLPRAVMMHYASGEMLLQCVLLSLSLNLSGRGRTPIISRLSEGRADSAVMVLIMMASNISYALGNTFSVFVYPCCIAIISALGCRLILSLHRACARSPSDPFKSEI